MGWNTRPWAGRVAGVALMGLAGAAPATAEMILTAPDGRKVELRDDFTWRYLPKTGRVIQDVWNPGGCGLTGTASVRLQNDAVVQRIVTWYQWQSSQQSTRAEVYDANGAVVVLGPMQRGSCDSRETSWCEGILTVGRTMRAGVYYLQATPPRICQNAQSNGQGFVRVYAGGPATAIDGSPVPAPRPQPGGEGLSGYTRTERAAISGHNNRHLKGVSPADCARACDRERSFICKSFDYYRDSRACDLSDKSAAEVGLKRNYPPYDHYSRR